MKATVIAEGAERTFVLVFETGDEVIDDRGGVLDVGEHLVACRREA